MAKDSLFRNSIGGYNKDDVNRYIEELDIRYTERGNELESEIKELKKELDELPSLRAEKERAERLSAELEALKKENADISEAIKAQGEELEAKNASLAEITTEKDALELRIKQLSERDEKLTMENARITAEFEIKSKELSNFSEKTDALRKQLENDKSEFEKRAEEMLIQIQTQAKSVINRANETAEQIIEAAKRKAGDISSSFEAAPAANTAKKKDSLSELFDSHKSKMDSFFAALSKSIRGEGK